MLRIVQISDTHLSENDPAAVAGWSAALAHINEIMPDLVVHTGDIVRDDPRCLADHHYAKSCLAELKCEWVAVPGNHDVGDGLPNCPRIDEDLLRLFRRNFGSDHWVRPVGNWLLIGVNDLVFDTGCPFESEQWRWIETILGQAGRRNIAVFLHKPPFLMSSDEADAGSMTVSGNGARRLWRLLRDCNVQLAACGHRHEHRTTRIDGISVVWCPTTSGLLDERTPPFPPVTPSRGLLEYRLLDSGFLHDVIPLDIPAADPRAAP